MRTRLILFLALVSLFLCLGADRRKPFGQLEILEIHAARTGDTMSFQGRLKNAGSNTVSNSKLAFVLLDTKNRVITTLRGPLEPDQLEPDAETDFNFECKASEDAVSVRIDAEDLKGKPIGMKNGGPHRIE
jgi:hypothetical protein